MTLHSGFDFSTLACSSLNLDDWKAIFGLEETVIGIPEPDEVNVFWFPESVEPLTILPQTMDKEHSFRDPLVWNPLPETTPAEPDSCNSVVCGMETGVCVDCSRCAQHCECISLTAVEDDTPFRTICIPGKCKPIVCSDCTRCTDHCTCKWDNQRQSISGLSFVSYESDSDLQELQRNRSSTSLRR